MKKLLIILLVPIFSYSQVGIATTSPTNTLDVNGSLRVRTLTEGTVQSTPTGVQFSAPYKMYATAVVDKSGTIYKQYGFSSIVSLGGGRYRFTFVTPMVDNNYIISGLGQGRTISYDNVTTISFEIVVSSTSGSFDFNVIIFDLI